MFTIRRIHDDIHPNNHRAIEQVQVILKQQFPGLAADETDTLREKLLNPFAKRFKTILYTAENSRGKVQGFAVLMHDPVAKFCYLDFVASGKGLTSQGIGGALYQRIREESQALGVVGLFFECTPDDPLACSTKALAKQNAARLRFYEQWGATPLLDIGYELPIKPGDLDMPHLVYDDLDSAQPPTRAYVRKVVRAILERKYADLCPPEYVAKVLKSIKKDPVAVRPLRYLKARPEAQAPSLAPIPMVVNELHDIHHVRERGYVEAPVRIRSILKHLDLSGMFTHIPAKSFAEKHITAVHEPNLVRFLQKVCKDIPDKDSVYPYVFPVRNPSRPPRDLSVCAGYYCIDTFTPLNSNSYKAARAAVDCTLTAAELVEKGAPIAYSLVRPPGHHAERAAFGGFCYFNNSAIAAHRLSRLGRVAILDVDYHHGNGQQDIFWTRNDVLTVSIHGHPSFAYPYFSGWKEEIGEDAGAGFNVNIPLPETIDAKRYQRALQQAIKHIRDFNADYLVVALGLDTARGDPTGSWALNAEDFEVNGQIIAGLRLPTLVVQEGGYLSRTLGANARRFFTGLATPLANKKAAKAKPESIKKGAAKSKKVAAE